MWLTTEIGWKLKVPDENVVKIISIVEVTQSLAAIHRQGNEQCNGNLKIKKNNPS